MCKHTAWVRHSVDCVDPCSIHNQPKPFRCFFLGKVVAPFPVEYDNGRWKGITSQFRSAELENIVKNGRPTIKYDGMNCMKCVCKTKADTTFHVLLIRYDRKLNKQGLALVKKRHVKLDVNDEKIWVRGGGGGMRCA